MKEIGPPRVALCAVATGLAFFLLAACPITARAQGEFTLVTVAGDPVLPVDVPARNERIFPRHIAIDDAGVLYLSPVLLRSVDLSTGLMNVAFDQYGIGEPTPPGCSADGGVWTQDFALLADRSKMLCSQFGSQDALFQIDLAALASTPLLLAENSNSAVPSGDGGVSIDADFGSIEAVAFADDGAALVVDRYPDHSRLRRIDPVSRVITTVAGSATPGPAQTGDLATQSFLGFLGEVVVVPGALILATSDKIYSVDGDTGVLTVLATGRPFITALAADDLAVYFAEVDNDRHRLARIDRQSLALEVLRDSPRLLTSLDEFGDNAPLAESSFSFIADMAFHAGDLYAADFGHRRIRKIDLQADRVTTVAGGQDPARCSVVDGRTDIDVRDMTFDPAGNLTMADQDNVIWRIDSTLGTVTPAIGRAGRAGVPQEGALVADALSSFPHLVNYDEAGFMFFAESSGIWRVDPETETISRISARVNVVDAMNEPFPLVALAASPDGSTVYVAGGTQLFAIDTATSSESLVRGFPALLGDLLTLGDGELLIGDADGLLSILDLQAATLTTIAGTGAATVDEAGGPALQTSLGEIRDLALAPDGTIAIASGVAHTKNARVWLLNPERTEISDPVQRSTYLDIAYRGDGRLFAFFSNRVAAQEPVATRIAQPPTASEGDEFARAVAASGNLFAAGLPGDDGGAGSVAVYFNDGCVFTLEAHLQVPDGFTAAGFGSSLALDGGRLAVGTDSPAKILRAAAKGANALQAALYERLGRSWRLKLPLEAPGAGEDGFGTSVELEGDRLLVGSPGEASGRIFEYDASSSNATPSRVIEPLAPMPGFGEAMDLSTDMLAVGAPAAGMVSVLDVSMATPVETVNLAAPASAIGFGSAVAFKNQMLAVGAPGEASKGSVSLYDVGGVQAILLANLLGPADDAEFGASVALDGSTLAVGAPAFGSGTSVGAVFIVEYTGIPGGKGVLSPLIAKSGPIIGDGLMRLGQTVALEAGRLVAGAPATLASRGDALFDIEAVPLFASGFETPETF